MKLQVSHLPHRASRRAAFTLLEVLVVVAILVILASVASVATFSYLEKAKKSKAQLQARTLANACDAYYADPNNTTGMYPQTVQQLITPPWSSGMQASFLKDPQHDTTDPWGGTFQIQQQAIDGSGTNMSVIVYTHSQVDNTVVSQFGQNANSKMSQ